MVWESLRALFLIGRKDLICPASPAFARSQQRASTEIRQQAQQTAQAISAHAAKNLPAIVVEFLIKEEELAARK